MLQYALPSAHLSLSQIFAKMEEAIHDLEVEDYSVSQNTLDNVRHPSLIIECLMT
jgi:hypothetical protein